MKLENVKTLIFDFGNVLLDIDINGALERLKSLMGIEESFDLLNATPNYFELYETGQISEALFINKIIEHADNRIQANEVVEIWNSMLVSIPKHRLDMLLDLGKKYQLFLLSNTNYTHIQWVHRYMKRTYQVDNFERHYFDKVFYSYTSKKRKPDPLFYQEVISDLGHGGHEALFFDDTEFNVIIANRVGLLSTYHDPSDDIVDHINRLGL